MFFKLAVTRTAIKSRISSIMFFFFFFKMALKMAESVRKCRIGRVSGNTGFILGLMFHLKIMKRDSLLCIFNIFYFLLPFSNMKGSIIKDQGVNMTNNAH